MKKCILFSFFLFYLFPWMVSAASADLVLEGNQQVNVGDTFSFNIAVRNIKGNSLKGAQAEFLVEDETCISMISLEAVSSGTTVGNEKAIIIFSSMSGVVNDFVVAKVTFKASTSSCSTNVLFHSIKFAYADNEKIIGDDFTTKLSVVDQNNLKLNKTKISMGKTETFDLQLLSGNVVVDPKSVVWKSGNLNVATIDSYGKVTGISKGNTTIEASYQGHKFFSSIEVLDYLKGDLDMNGKITVRDASMALSIYTGGVMCTPLLLLIGDMNDDGKIMVKDASLILRKYTSGY